MTFTGWSDGTLGSATRPGSSLARNPPAHGPGRGSMRLLQQDRISPALDLGPAFMSVLTFMAFLLCLISGVFLCLTL